MELRVFWRSLRQRWYLVLALAVLTVAATFLVGLRVGPSYEATGTVLVFPPSQTPGTSEGTTTRGNPYLGLGGVNQARDVLVRALTSKTMSDEFGGKFPPGTTFEAVPDYTNSAPIILFTVEGQTPGAAVDALGWLMNRVPVELEELQSGLDLPPAEKVTALPLTQDERPTTLRKGQIRAAILAAAALGGAGLLLIALIDGLVAGRRAAQGTPDEPDDTPPASGPPPDDERSPPAEARRPRQREVRNPRATGVPHRPKPRAPAGTRDRS